MACYENLNPACNSSRKRYLLGTVLVGCLIIDSYISRDSYLSKVFVRTLRAHEKRNLW